MVNNELSAVLSQIAQKGFMVKAEIGISLREFLCRQGIPDRYVEETITTLFIDGKPVDDIDAAHIKEGSTLSLSAAMPGLVGATMRRGGVYSTLRSDISYHEDQDLRAVGEGPREGIIRIKLFNMLLRDLVPVFFEKGVYVTRAEAAFFPKEVLKDFHPSDIEEQRELVYIKLNLSGVSA
jgi:hypothetical protein